MLDKEYEVYKKASARTNRRNRGYCHNDYIEVRLSIFVFLSKFAADKFHILSKFASPDRAIVDVFNCQ